MFINFADTNESLFLCGLHFLRIASSHNLPSYVLNLLYFALLHSHIIYCLEIYSSCSDSSLLKKVESKRKAAARIICKADRLYPSAPLFRFLKWPTLEEIISQRLTQFVCLSNSPFGPSYLPNFLAPSHKYGTRFSSAQNFQQTSVDKISNARTVFVRATNNWNSLPFKDSLPSVSLIPKKFKNQIKLLFAQHRQ